MVKKRIWLDETIRSYLIEQNENLSDYNSVLVYQIEDGFLSIKRFRQALKNVLNKHSIFRTSYSYDANEHCVKQMINPMKEENYSFELTYFDRNDFPSVDQIIFQEQTKKYFDLNDGKIFRCHLFKHDESEKNRLIKDDYILFIFHHSAIDEFSKFLFLKDLTLAYQIGQIDSDENQFRLIDYSFYERQMDLSECQSFWKDYFSDYHFHEKVNLPYDKKTLNSISSGSFHFFQIDKSLTRQIFRYKNQTNLNFFRLFLATFYCFLFKLTQDTDIAITGVTPNRYDKQLNQIIGPLENFVVYRLILDPHKSFSQLNTQVEQVCLNVKNHSNYPYQELVAYARKISSVQYPFNQLSLRVFIDDDQWILDNDNHLILKKIYLENDQLFQRNNRLTPIELTLNVLCNLEKQTIHFYFHYSNQLFTEEKFIY